MEFGNYVINNEGKINIIMGKNGCGKSTLLRELEKEMKDKYNIKYISPERGGSLTYNPNIEQTIFNDPNRLSNTRRNNRADSFKQQTIAQYKDLELSILRSFEKDTTSEKFEQILGQINALLDNVEIRRNDKSPIFEAYEKGTNNLISPDVLSSGETELVSLAIECLVFVKKNITDKKKILLLDEPDVHLHPDLQVKLMLFIKSIVEEYSNINIFISTHSTAIVGAFSNYDKVKIFFMKSKDKNLNFEDITEKYHQILPIFGAHPLSNLFCEKPILIVEGEDDVRIRQQVVRSSNGKIQIYPCEAGDIQSMDEVEKDTQKILTSVYDSALGYSLRDSDGITDDLDDYENLIRCRLKCRNAENLLLSDESLQNMGTTFDVLKGKIDDRLNEQSGKTDKHDKFSILKDFKEKGYDRKNFQTKDFRNMIPYFTGSDKSWEIIVGQSIALNISSAQTIIEKTNTENSIFQYLGNKFVENIIINNIIINNITELT